MSMDFEHVRGIFLFCDFVVAAAASFKQNCVHIKRNTKLAHKSNQVNEQKTRNTTSRTCASNCEYDSALARVRATRIFNKLHILKTKIQFGMTIQLRLVYAGTVYWIGRSVCRFNVNGF